MVDRIDDLQRYKLDKKGVEERNRWIQSFSSGAFIIERNSHDPETKERIKNILGNDELDFLFIDGDHTYEGAKKDYEMYSEYVKKGGVIAFHDINETELHKSQNCRVYKLWQELTGEKLIFSQNQVWGGIGVLIK